MTILFPVKIFTLVFRRGRAMAKIAASLEADSGFIKAKNLTQLFLPLAGSYLLNDTYAR